PSHESDRAAASPFSRSREPKTSRIPLLASWRTTSRPIPRLAPVTTATKDSLRISILAFLNKHCDLLYDASPPYSSMLITHSLKHNCLTNSQDHQIND